MEGSNYPVLTALKISAFMKEYSNVDVSNHLHFKGKSREYSILARKILKQTKSDHLCALLLFILNDVNHDNIMDIAIRNSFVQHSFFIAKCFLLYVKNTKNAFRFDTLSGGS